MNNSYSTWDQETIIELNLPEDTIGTLMKLQSIKESNYLDYYYGDIALTIMRRNLLHLRNKEYTDQEIYIIVKTKANYYKIFRNKRLDPNLLTDEDLLRVNYDISRIIKATLITKSNNEKAMQNSNNLAKGNFNYLTNIHTVFRLINKLNKIKQKSFEAERAKLDSYYDQKLEELEDLEEYHRILAAQWKKDLIS